MLKWLIAVVVAYACSLLRKMPQRVFAYTAVKVKMVFALWKCNHRDSCAYMSAYQNFNSRCKQRRALTIAMNAVSLLSRGRLCFFVSFSKCPGRGSNKGEGGSERFELNNRRCALVSTYQVLPAKYVHSFSTSMSGRVFLTFYWLLPSILYEHRGLRQINQYNCLLCDPAKHEIIIP